MESVYVELPAGQDLPSLWSASIGVAAPMLALALGAAVAMLLMAWVLRRPEGRSLEVWLGGAGIGAVIAATWWVSGRLGYLPEDPNTLEPAFLATNFRRMESLSMVAPVGYALDWLLFFSDKAKVLTLGVVSVIGVAVGACLASESASFSVAYGRAGWTEVFDDFIGPSICHAVIARDRG